MVSAPGIKITYNTQLDPESGRLIFIDVWDQEKKEYLPLERLKLYKFATDNWMCDHFDPYPSLLKGFTIEGEVDGVVDTSRPIQDIVGSYLSDLSDLGITYDTSTRGSHINNTEALEQMQIIQSAESCSNLYFWNQDTLTCLPCPGGEHVKFAEDLMSFVVTPNLDQDLEGRNILMNRELINVTLAPKQVPAWVVLKPTNGSTDFMSRSESIILQPGDSFPIEFDINSSALGEGTARSPVSFGEKYVLVIII
jgi:hypothetical protein